MKDANGTVVYPISYNGTTYVPLRAVSNMMGLPVDWNGDTRTVYLGAADRQPDQLHAIARTTNTNQFTSMTGASNFPQPVDDFGNKTELYTFGYYTRRMHNGAVQSTGSFSISAKYTELEFVAYIEGEGTIAEHTITVTNAAGTVLSRTMIKSGEFVTIKTDITGCDTFTITSRLTNSRPGTLYLLNPVLR